MHSTTAIAAAAALLALSACATGGGQVQQDVVSLRTEVRTLQRENAELARRVESMATQIDLLAARGARPAAPTAGGDRPAPAAATAAPAPSAPASLASVAALDDALVIPSDLKVIRLEPTRKPSNSKPVVPTATPIQDPSAEAIAALGAGGKSSSDAQAAFERARAQAGLPGARALEQFADGHPSSVRAGEALVDAARRRRDAGDPDGSCEDFSRAVAEFPSSRAMPDALEGLAACELRRGRSAEASRLQTRLAKDFPDSPAGKRAREHVPPVQGAAP